MRKVFSVARRLLLATPISRVPSATATTTTHFCQYSALLFSSCRRVFMIPPIIVSGPSGGGKSTILNRAFKEHPDVFALSISHTTRGPREGETNGKHYHFVSKEEMHEMIKNGEFFEHAEFGGNMYGTSKRAVSDIQGTGRICVLDVELQGVRSFKCSKICAKYILIKPPSFEALEQRLKLRGTETEDSLAKRLKRAREDDAAIHADPSLFDHVIVNMELDKAYAEFLAAIDDELKQFGRNGESNNRNNGNNNHHS